MQSASILSGVLQSGKGHNLLNAQIALWMVVKQFPSLHEQVFRGAVLEGDEHRLFDACVSNPYAEAIPIGLQYFGVLEAVGLQTALNTQIC